MKSLNSEFYASSIFLQGNAIQALTLFEMPVITDIIKA